MNQTKIAIPLNQALAQIERARANLIATTNSLPLSADQLGKLATIDDSLGAAEREFETLCVEVTIEENREHADTKQ